MTKPLHPAHILRNKVARALESGKYEQTKGFLRFGFGDDTFAYCCLGVAADCVFNAEWEAADHNYNANTFTAPGTDYDTQLGIEWTEELFGDTTDPASAQGELARLNDAGATFKEIAALFRLDGPKLHAALTWSRHTNPGSVGANGAVEALQHTDYEGDA